MNAKRILIVDDEPHVIRVLRLTLEREGYVVDAANDGMQALEKIEDCCPDVLVTDLNMPKAGGRHLCESARSRFADKQFLIIVMTSMTAIEERNWTGKLDHVEFLEKPISPRRLASRIAAYFNALTVAGVTS